MQRIDFYEIRSVLAKDHLTTFYSARDTSEETPVMLWRLEAAAFASAEVRRFLLRDYEALSRSRHAAVAAVYGWLEHEGQLVLVLEHCAGPTILEACRGQTPAAKLLALADLCRGLGHAQGQEVGHGGLRPTLIRRGEDGKLKAFGFGLARLPNLLAPELGGTTEQRAEIARYLPPEHGTVTADARTDIFAAGAIAYELLAGRGLLEGREADRTVTPDDLQGIEGISEGEEADVVEILYKALHPDPKQRFESCHELALAFAHGADVLEGLVTRRYRGTDAPSKARKPPTAPPVAPPVSPLSAEETVRVAKRKEEGAKPAPPESAAPLVPPRPAPGAPAPAPRPQPAAAAPKKKAEPVAAGNPAPAAAPPRAEKKPRPAKKAERPAAAPRPAKAALPAGATPPWVRPATIALFALAGLALIAALAGLLLGGGEQALAPGFVALDVLPWAEVTAVKPAGGGKAVALPGKLITPCRLSLPAGSYQVTVRHPQWGEKTLEVAVRSGETNRVASAWSGASGSLLEGLSRPAAAPSAAGEAISEGSRW